MSQCFLSSISILFIYCFLFFQFFHKGSGKMLDYKCASGKSVPCLLAEKGPGCQWGCQEAKGEHRRGGANVEHGFFMRRSHMFLHFYPNEHLWGVNAWACLIHKGNQRRNVLQLVWDQGAVLHWDVSSALRVLSTTPSQLPWRKVFHTSQNTHG